MSRLLNYAREQVIAGFDEITDNVSAHEIIAIFSERDELREQVARLEAHVEQLTSLLDGQFVGQEYWGLAAFDSLLSERDFLRAALEKYGRHLYFCAITCCPAPVDRCSCGLAEALGFKP